MSQNQWWVALGFLGLIALCQVYDRVAPWFGTSTPAPVATTPVKKK